MRPDMSKVIVERPRWGSRMSLPRRFRRIDMKHVALDEDEVEPMPGRVGHRRAARLTGRSKSLSENLNPLRRWLEKQIGRRWDDVWSELTAHLRADNTVQQHVRDHVADFVAWRTFERGGEIFAASRRWGSPRPVGDWRGPELYVDPATAVLCRARRRNAWKAVQRRQEAERRRALAARMRVVDQRRQLHLLADGSWWEVTLAAVPTGTIVEAGRRRTVYLPVTDVVLRTGLSTLAPADLYDRHYVHAVAKRPLSAREIRSLGLRQPAVGSVGSRSPSAPPPR